jgi:hypothetical protein
MENGIVTCFDFYDENAAIEEVPTDYAKGNELEDWAVSFKVLCIHLQMWAC